MPLLQRTHAIVLCGFLVAEVTSLSGTSLLAADKATIPSAGAQSEASARVKDVFGQEQAQAQSSEQKTALAQKLLQTAKGSGQDAADRFVLLRFAWDLATQAGDASLAMQITDEISAVFEVDARRAKLATVKTMDGFMRTARQSAALATIALDVINEAVIKDDYAGAQEAAAIGMAAARRARDWSLVKQFAACDKEIKEGAEAYAGIQAALAKLETDPTNPAANQAVGEYFWFVKGDPEAGILMLALGDDKALKTMAYKDLKGAGSTDEHVELGDGWWDVAQSHEGKRKELLLMRAGGWYGAAKPKLSPGLTLAKVEKRLEQIERIGPPVAATGPSESGAPNIVPDGPRMEERSARDRAKQPPRREPFQPGVVFRLHSGQPSADNATPLVAVGASSEDFDARLRGKAEAELRAMGVRPDLQLKAYAFVCLREPSEVAFDVTNCTCVLDGREITPRGKARQEFKLPLAKGAHPIVMWRNDHGQPGPSFRVIDAKSGENVLFYSEDLLRHHLAMPVRFGGGVLMSRLLKE